MNHTHNNTIANAKRLVASVLLVTLWAQHATPALAITYDASTNTYFESIDDFGLATGSDSVGLQFGGSLGEFLRFNRATDRFVLSDDLDVQGTLSGAALTIMGGASYLLGNVGIGTSATPQARLEVAGVISGSSLKITGTAAISGALVLENGGSLSGSSLTGFGLLTDCDNATTSKLLWDAATGRFSCGTDQSGAGGLSLSDADARYVRKSGGTMTGKLALDATSIDVKGSGSIVSHDWTDVVLVVRGTGSQSANLQEWQDPSGTSLANVTAGGQLNAQYGNFSSLMSTTYADVTSSLNVTGNAIFGSDSNDSVTFNADVITSILPDANVAYNLGSDSYRWNYVYGNNGNFSGEMYAGGVGNVANVTMRNITNCNGGSALATDMNGSVYCDTDDSGTGWGSDYFNISDGTTTETVDENQTITFADGANINVSVGMTDTVTIALDNAYLNDVNQYLNSSATVNFYDVTTSNNLSASNSAFLGNGNDDYVYFGGDVNSSFNADSNNTYDIGNTSNRWATGWFNSLNVSDTGYFGGNLSTESALLINPDNSDSFVELRFGANDRPRSFAYDNSIDDFTLGDSLYASGSLLATGTLSGARLYGLGLVDCDTMGTSKLLWDATTGRFSCGTDQTGGTSGGTYTAGQGLNLSAGNAFSLQTTITGSMVNFRVLSGATLTLNGSGTVRNTDPNDVVLAVRAAPTQIANLQEWRDSSNNMLANVSATGNISTNNSLFVGGDNNDYLYIGADVNSSFNADANNSYSIGNSTNRWQNIFSVSGNVSGVLEAGTLNSLGALDVNGATTLDGNVNLGDTSADNVSFNALVNTMIAPATNNTYSFGNSTNRWSTGWFNSANLSSSLSVLDTSSLTGNVGVGAGNSTSKAVLSVTGTISGATVYATRSFSGAGLTDCDTAGTSKLLWDATTGRFSCGTDQGSSYTAGQGLMLNGSSFRLNATVTGSLARFGTLSGYTVFAKDTLASSGTILLKNTATSADMQVISTASNANGYFDSGTNNNAGLVLRENGANKWTFLSQGTTDNLVIAGDSGMGTDDFLTITQAGNVGIGAGSSMTPDAKLEVVGTVSGATVYAERQLSVSGSVTLGEDAGDNVVFNAEVNSAITPNANNSFDFGGSAARWATGWFNSLNTSAGISVLGTSSLTGNVGIGSANSTTKAVLAVTGTISGATVYATRSFSGAGLTDCDTAGTSKLLWDATTGRFSCGTDQTGGTSGGTYFAGQGLSLNGANSFRLNAAVTGSTIHAVSRLSSSGSAIIHGAGAELTIFGSADEVKPLIVAKSVSSEASQVFLNTTTGHDKSADGLYLGNYHGPAFLVNRESSSLWLGTSGIAYAGINSAGNMLVGNNGVGGYVGTEVEADAKLEVVGTVSGASFFGGSFFQASGLSDCDNATTSKLLWDSTTGRFSCGTDQSGGSSGGGMAYSTASGIFLKRSGGTMTGSLALSGSKLTVTPGLAPATASGIDLNANVNTLFVTGNYAYTVSDSVTGHEYRAIDIANPNAPVIVGGFDTGQNTKALFVSTRHVFIGMNGTGAGSGMYILDNGNPGTPTVVGRLNFGWAVNNIYVSGKYAYVGLNAATSGVCMAKYQLYSGCDFAIVDFTDANRPRIIGGLQIGANVNQMHVQNRYAYLAVDSVSGNDFRIIDIANPLSPIAVGGLDLGNNVKSVYASGKYAYIGLSADAGTEFRVIDVSNKTSPTSIGGIETGTAVQSIIVTGDWARIGTAAGAGNDMHTVDLRAPTTPRLYGGADFGAGVNDVMVAGKYAYVALTSVAGNDFRIVDLAGIEAPSATIGSLATGHLFASDNVRFDNNAYVRNALNVGRGGIISKGALSIQSTGTGSAKGNTGTLLNAFDVRNGTGQHLFSVSENGTVQAGLPSFSTGTMMIALNMMSRRSGYCTPLITSATTYTSVGMSTCTVNGTATAWPGGGRMKLKMAAANTASAMAGITTVFTETRPQFRPKILFDVTTGTGTTGLRFYGGIVESSTAAQALTVGSAASAIDYVALAWEDGISGTQWLCCSGDGTNHSCQSMGVPVQTNTEYMGQVDWSQPGRVTCSLQVGAKTYRTTKTTNISVANVSLGENVVLVNKSIGGAAARVMYNSRLVLEQN